MVLELTDANFKPTIAQADKMVVVRFWANWSAVCMDMNPVFEGFSNECEDKVIVGKVDVDENPETVGLYPIINVPTILFIKNGEVVDKVVGGVTKANLLALLNKHI